MTDQIKLLFIDGSFIDFDRPPDFNLPTFIHGCRSMGFVLGIGFYVPFGLVKAVLDMSTSHVMYGTAGAPLPNAPTTEKPQ